MTNIIPYKNWRRIVALVLAVVFLFSSLGFSYYTHYCPFKGSSVSLFSEKSSCCATDDESDNGCCKNESGQIKINDSYNASKGLDFSIDKQILKAVSQQIITLHISVVTENEKQLYQTDSSPPGLYSVAIFLFDRSILI